MIFSFRKKKKEEKKKRWKSQPTLLKVVYSDGAVNYIRSICIKKINKGYRLENRLLSVISTGFLYHIRAFTLEDDA